MKLRVLFFQTVSALSKVINHTETFHRAVPPLTSNRLKCSPYLTEHSSSDTSTLFLLLLFLFLHRASSNVQQLPSSHRSPSSPCPTSFSLQPSLPSTVASELGQILETDYAASLPFYRQFRPLQTLILLLKRPEHH